MTTDMWMIDTKAVTIAGGLVQGGGSWVVGHGWWVVGGGFTHYNQLCTHTMHPDQ